MKPKKQAMAGFEASLSRLYEDDGSTYAYESGATAATKLRCRAKGDAVYFDIGARTGDYAGKPAARTYLVMAHVASEPDSISDGDCVPGEHLFRFSSPGLKPCETRIRKPPPILGLGD